MKPERLLYDTGRIPLLILLAMSPFGLLAFFGAIASARQSPISAAGFGAFGLFMLSAWFWRYRFYYDATRHEIVVRSPIWIWISRRLPLTGAVSLSLHDARDPLTGQVVGTDIGIRYADGRRRWLTQVMHGDPGHVAAMFSEAASLPILPEVEPWSRGASLVWNTLIVGLMIIGSFLWRQPAVFLWPFRVFCVIALVGLWRQILRGTRK